MADGAAGDLAADTRDPLTGMETRTDAATRELPSPEPLPLADTSTPYDVPPPAVHSGHAHRPHRRPRRPRGRPVRITALPRRVVAAARTTPAHPLVLRRRGHPPDGPHTRATYAHEPRGPRRTHPRRLVLPGPGPLARRTGTLRPAPARRPRGTGTPGARTALPRTPRQGTGCVRARRPRIVRVRAHLPRRGPGQGTLRRDQRRRGLRRARDGARPGGPGGSP